MHKWKIVAIARAMACAKEALPKPMISQPTAAYLASYPDGLSCFIFSRMKTHSSSYGIFGVKLNDDDDTETSSNF